jgi:hypothetical protein
MHINEEFVAAGRLRGLENNIRGHMSQFILKHELQEKLTLPDRVLKEAKDSNLVLRTLRSAGFLPDCLLDDVIKKTGSKLLKNAFTNLKTKEIRDKISPFQM